MHIFILFFFLTNGGNPAGTTAEFSSKKACMEAGAWLVEQNSWVMGHAWFHCLAKDGNNE